MTFSRKIWKMWQSNWKVKKSKLKETINVSNLVKKLYKKERTVQRTAKHVIKE